MTAVSLPVRRDRRFSELKPGDHIKWKRAAAYDHHAIVESVSGNSITVIEYGSPGGGSSSGKGRITRHTYTLDDIRRMYRYVYDSCDCKTCNDDVVQLAQEKLKDDSFSSIFSEIGKTIGITGYNPLRNNCEHLARYCKTGKKSCSQVLPFLVRSLFAGAAACVGGASTLVSRCAAVGAHSGAGHWAKLQELFCNGGWCETACQGGKEVGKNVGQLGLKLGYKAGILGATSAVVEGGLFCYNWYQATQKYNRRMKVADDEDMRLRVKQEWKNDMMDAGAEAVGGVAGSVVGGLLGSVVPVFGTAIGAAVGSLLGRWGARSLSRWWHG